VSAWREFGDWKIITESGETLLKVVGFPGGESMWVRVVEGSDFEGIGILENEPICSNLRLGERIRYDNGDEDRKPEFVRWGM